MAGPATGTPVVLVPGLGALGYVRPFVEVLARDAPVVLLDLPGFGRLRTARLPADLATLAAVLGDWLRTRPPVLLVGHSTGAQIALRAALAVPVAGLVLAGAVFPPEARTPGAVARRVLRTLPAERPGELPAVLPHYLRGARRLPELLRSALADRPEDVVDEARPLVLRGQHDRLCPQPWAERLARSGELRVLPGGHNTPWTHPEQTAAAVLQGLSRTGPRPPRSAPPAPS